MSEVVLIVCLGAKHSHAPFRDARRLVMEIPDDAAIITNRWSWTGSNSKAPVSAVIGELPVWVLA